jgi:hypothetical protein
MNTAYRSIFYTKRALLGLYDCLKFESIKIFRHADGFSLRPCGNNVTGNFIKIDNIDFHVIFICIYEKLDSKNVYRKNSNSCNWTESLSTNVFNDVDVIILRYSIEYNYLRTR